MDFITITIELLNKLAVYAGSYGMAIIIFTLIVRFALWPMYVTQMRSMRKTQAIAPKMKMIQEKYKNNPQQMQQKIMELYKNNDCNPTAGCLPLLIQLPIFCLLYWSFISPQFIQIAGNTHFLFISRLDATIQSNVGMSFDGKFSLSNNPKFQSEKIAKVYINDEVIDNVKIEKPQKALSIQGEIVNGEPVEFKIPINYLNLKFAQLDNVTGADIDIKNLTTREVETAHFTKRGDILAASVPTVAPRTQIHYDVLALLVLFIITILISNQIMMAYNAKIQDPAQAAVQKKIMTFMPIFIAVPFAFFPIPAGVLLYLVTSNVFQIFQTVVVNRQLDMEMGEQKQNKNDNVIEATVVSSSNSEEKK